MADITMCGGEGCQKKDECYRFTATPSDYWQAFFTVSPVDDNGNCDQFWRDDYGRQTRVAKQDQ